MEQGNIATPDELQQAINSITNNNTAQMSGAVDMATPAESVTDSVVESVAESVAENAAAATPEEVEPVASPAPATSTTVAATETVKAQYGDPDLDKVKSMALSDLRPILDKVDLTPDKKFMIYKEMIVLTDDKACIEPAYNAAREIEDEKAKGEALVFIIECIDKLGIQVTAEGEEK